VRSLSFRSLQALGGIALAAASAVAQPGPAGAPLAPFAAQKLVVMPVQFLRADSASPVKNTDWPDVRKELDDSIGTAIAERGIGKKWAYASDIVRLSKRNAGYVTDPYTLGSGSLRPPRALKPDDQAPRILIDNLRSHIALGDARYALVPVELAFAKRGPETGATMRFVLIDGRVGQIVWYADVLIPSQGPFSSAAMGAVGQRVADLVAAR
jgi:hypothetical protein